MEPKSKIAPCFRGWNTYYNNSVLTHVLLPEGFGVHLGLKCYSTGQVLDRALIGRLGEQTEKIIPHPRSYDGTYTGLTVTFGGTEALVESTAAGENLELLVTPLVTEKMPAALLVGCSPVWGRPGYALGKEQSLRCVLPDREFEVFVGGTRIPEYNAGICGAYLAVRLDEPIVISTRENRTVSQVRQALDRAKSRMEQTLDDFRPHGEAYAAMRTCMAWDTVYEPEKDRICTPVSRLWNIQWGGYVLFCWDTFFGAFLAAAESEELACANVRAILAETTREGFVPNYGAASDDKSRDRSQPPVGSMMVEAIFRKYRNRAFVEEVFEDLLRWNRWFAAHRQNDDGSFSWGSEPYEPIADKELETVCVNQAEGAALESGLDNSPMYDGAGFDPESHRMCLADVGLTGLYIADCQALWELAREIGREDAARELLARKTRAEAGLETLWDETAGMYCNRDTRTGAFRHRYSPTNFYAFFSSRVGKDRQDRMLEHFYNPEEFWGEYILPSIARNDPAYPEQIYWRGRIWAPLNFLVYLALRRRGLRKPCRDLAEKSEGLLLKEWRSHGHVHENYNADSGAGCDSVRSDRFYHWGGLLGAIALMEDGLMPGPEPPEA